MLSKLRSGMTFSNVVSMLALCIALGGTSYAALSLPKNSVGAKQIRANAVTSSKVKDRSLLAQDFAGGQLPAGARGATGARGDKGDSGARGDTGAKGDAGAPGTAGTARAFAVVKSDATFDAARTKNFTAVRHGSITGVFCLTPAAGISPASTPAVASLDFNDAATGNADRAIVRSDPHFDCTAGEYEVLTTHDNGTADAFADKGFVIVVP